MNNDPYVEIRHAMVENQIAFRDVCDVRVLNAMREVPRHLFVPPEMIGEAYADRPLPIGLGQTISQPYIVAFMAEMLELWPTNSVLEVGTGCGYHAAVLSKLCAHVITVEIIPELAAMAAKNLCAAGCENVEIVVGDGALGWPKGAPYDAISAACAAASVPKPLLDQLTEGGRLVMPVDTDMGFQALYQIRLLDGTFRKTPLLPVRFVPMVDASGHPVLSDTRS